MNEQLSKSEPRGHSDLTTFSLFFFFFFFFFFFVFSLFKAAPTAYGGPRLGVKQSCSRDLCHSHSNAGSKPSLQPTPQLTAMAETCEARDRTCILVDTNWVPLPLNHDGNSSTFLKLKYSSTLGRKGRERGPCLIVPGYRFCSLL